MPSMSASRGDRTHSAKSTRTAAQAISVSVSGTSRSALIVRISATNSVSRAYSPRASVTSAMRRFSES